MRGPMPPAQSLGDVLVKSARFNRLLASTALGLVLVLGSHAGNPQEALAQQSEQKIEAAVPMPDTDLLPPLTAKDVASTPSTPSTDIKAEPKHDAAAPAAEPATAAAVPAATPASATAGSGVVDPLPAARPTARVGSHSTRRATTSRCG